MKESWWWVSIINLDKPEGQRFHGVYMVYGASPVQAQELVNAESPEPAHFEAEAHKAPEWAVPPEEYRNRRLDKEEATMLDLIFKAMMPGREREEQ